jgi:predicted metalloprotease with PDZ domain
MRHKLTGALSTALVLIAIAVPALGQTTPLEYNIELGDPSEDLFHVRLAVDGLGANNDVYQFASTAPGTYQVMDVGRFVRSFEAFDAAGESLATEQVNVNQWRIEDPSRVRSIEYSIGETWDNPVEEHPIYPMAGTSIESNHVLFNPHAVVGFPAGLQDAPVHVHLEYPEGWQVGTALERADDGGFAADDYDHLVDSPILLGELTVASTEVGGAAVEIYTYSKSGGVRSEQLLGSMSEMLESAGEFLGELPVDRYVFLFHFEWAGQTAGAWEHSYSSEYVLPDIPFSEHAGAFITDIAAHEFLHIITPLNIHSEIIERFNFEQPVPSAHLWLYEGVTEWGAHAMQLRSGLTTIEEHLDVIAGKIQQDRQFRADYSLEQLSLTSYSEEGQSQFPNVYQRGALVGELLDILLLDLSDGESGLQDLLQKLMRYYGKGRAFPDCGFYDVVAAMTYPEILEFFERYVQHAEPLPISEYYGKLGIDVVTDDQGQPVGFEIQADADERQLMLRKAWSENE